MMGHWNDQLRAATALEILEDAEVMKEFDDSYWLRVDKELYDEFMMQGKAD